MTVCQTRPISKMFLSAPFLDLSATSTNLVLVFLGLVVVMIRFSIP